jgi:hypothetical protein
MLVGYNTNISYKGTVYHVQTEDSGIRNPHIITLLYHKGTILARKKTGYAHIAAAPDYQEKVRELMKEQHKSMIRELIHGKHTQDKQAAPPGGDLSEEAEGEEEEKPSPPPAAAAPQPSPEEPPRKPAPASKAQISKSLDDILLDYILREEAK